MRSTLFSMISAIVLSITAAAPGGAVAADAAVWRPGQNVEIVVPFAAGGGNDVPARILQKILTGNRLIESSVMVVNKPGGGGTLGLIYLNEHAGNGNYLSLISTSTLTSHIIGTSKINYTDVTPIVPLVVEYIGFAVKADSPYRTFRDLIEAMKKDSTSLSFAVGGGLGNPNHTAIAAALKASGADVRKMKAVAFGGGSEALTAVMGGHVDVLAVAAGVLAPHVKSGKLRVVAVGAPARLERELADVPTLKEQGVNGVFAFSRYIVGPKDLPAPQVAFWEKVFSAAMKTEAWKAEAVKRNWGILDMSASAIAEDLKQQYGQLRAVLNDLGMAK